MKKSEILAPAGSLEQLIAAVRTGADAVYLGTDSFNARQSAENFGKEKLFDAVSYCHARNVKVYVAMNTLILDTEKEKAIENIKLIAQSGADAIIAQDLAVAKMFREHCPTIPLHASTQMTVHNIMGLKALEKLGFKRVVPARELSLDEIKILKENTDMEIEVFIHGALCMSVSGSCYLSSIIGGRSGNRGRCAQPCRLNFNCKNREYALSLKDSSLISHIKELENAGVTSFKIEGRMKRPEYVAAAVSACIDARNSKPYNIDALESVFSRSGFTQGYLQGKRNLDMFGYRTKEDVTKTQNVLTQLSDLYKDEIQKIPLTCEFIANENYSEYTVSDGKNTVTVKGYAPQKAINKPLDRDFALKCFSKTGGTVFFISDFKCNIGENLSLSASQMNSMRREALEKLYSIRSKIKPHNFIEAKENTVISSKAKNEVKYLLRFSSVNQIIDNTYSSDIILPYGEILKNPTVLEKCKNKLIAELPILVFPENEDNFILNLTKLKELGIKKVYCENIGACHCAVNMGFTVIGGSYLNILNSDSAKEYEKIGLSQITLSHELNMNHIKKIKSSKPLGLVGYGFIPLMRFRVCPAQTKKGCVGCTGFSVIKDRFGTDFYISCSNKKYSSLLNSVPLYIGDKQTENIDFITLYFTFEKKDLCQKIFDLYRNKQSLPTKKTGGLYFRELL